MGVGSLLPREETGSIRQVMSSPPPSMGTNGASPRGTAAAEPLPASCSPFSLHPSVSVMHLIVFPVYLPRSEVKSGEVIVGWGLGLSLLIELSLGG